MDDAITQFTESIEHFVAGGEPPDSRLDDWVYLVSLFHWSLINICTYYGNCLLSFYRIESTIDI